MEFLKNKILWLPPLLFLALFSLDKVLLLDAIQEHTLLWKKIEPPFYYSRNALFEQILQEKEATGLILGSSRAGEFSSETFASLTEVKRTYNFSAPLTCPAYYAYWIDRLLGNGVQPAFVIMETDALLFSDAAVAYSLNYSFSDSFVLAHTDFLERKGRGFDVQGRGFTFDEAEIYFLKRSFALFRFPLDLKAVQENNQEFLLPDGKYMTGRQARKELLKLIAQANQTRFGGIPNPLQFTVPEDKMAEDARLLAERHLTRPPSLTQILFFKEALERLAKEKIPVVVYWPLVSGPLYAIYKDRGYLDGFQQELLAWINGLKTRYPNSHIAFLDPNPAAELPCRNFVDSSHLSGICFDDITVQIVEQLPQKLRRRSSRE